MGLLIEDKILSWVEMKPYLTNYKHVGIEQFIRLYKKYKTVNAEPYVWGYEMEYMLIKKKNNQYILNLIGDKLIDKLENKFGKNSYKPEYANWMIEKIPDEIFNSNLLNLVYIYKKLQEELKIINNYQERDCYAICMCVFPLLGKEKIFNLDLDVKNNEFSKSLQIPDNTINPHIRFRTITQNIRERRNKKIDIQIPKYKDKYTDGEMIKMDCMGFGMGNCCLQITMQMKDIDQCMYLYDQFAILSPILLNLSGACAVLNGYLSNNLSRWNIIEQSVDDRNKNDKLDKSRYSSISTFIHEKGTIYNDIELNYEIEHYDNLIINGIPENIAKHIAYLFTRDPVIMYEKDIEDIEKNNPENSNFFQNINSSNWNNVRFKPPLNENDSWKLEIRMLDLQYTLFENACFIIFVNLLARVITHYNLDLYMPISLVDKNCISADSINNRLYYFKLKNNFKLYDISEIIDYFIDLIEKYIKEYHTTNLLQELQIYLDYIRDLSTNKIERNADKIRNFVLSHPNYKKDSVVTNSISNDLISDIIKRLMQEIN